MDVPGTDAVGGDAANAEDNSATLHSAGDSGMVAGVADARTPATPTPDAPHDALSLSISAEHPVGEDPRLLEEFEQVGAELAKIGGAERLPVDWALVESISSELLRSHTKDARLACYRAAALYQIEGTEGLVRGLETLGALLTTFGAALHPARAKAKLGAFAWLSELVAESLKDQEITPELWESGRATARVCLEQCQTLELDTRPFQHLLGAFERMAVLPTDEQRKAQVRSIFPEGMGTLGESMLDTAELRAQTDDDAISLRLRRWALWMTPPAMLGDSRRDCDAGVKAVEGLAELAQRGQWKELLRRAEATLRTYPFALDISVLSARAAAHTLDDESVRALVGELSGLLVRVPSLPLELDRNGSPLASADARAWIRAELGDDDRRADGTDDAAVLPREARQHLEASRMDEAMRAAAGWLSNSTGRTRFARSVALANAFSEFDAPEQAFTVFRGLHGHLRALTVKEWDPGLFAACLEGYLISKRRAEGLGPEDQPLLEELSVLDPTSIMHVIPKH